MMTYITLNGPMKSFGVKLRELREEKRFTQSELAKSLGTYQSQIARWEGGKKPPKLDYLLKMARVLGGSLDYLARDEVETNETARPRPEGLTPEEDALLGLLEGAKMTPGDLAVLLGVKARRKPKRSRRKRRAK